MLNQLLFGIVVLFSAGVALGMDAVNEVTILLTGMLIVFLLTSAAIAIPWNRIHPQWSALLPIGDILAIALLRESNPNAGLALLWIFPAMWMAGSFALAGLIVANVLTNGLYLTIVLVDPRQSITPVVVLMPLIVFAVSMTSYLAARRASAQRILLERQARLLVQAVDRAVRQEDLVTEMLDTVDFGVIRIDEDGEVSVRNEAHARLQRLLDTEEPDAAMYAEDGLTPLSEQEMPLARARRGERFDRMRVWYGAPGSGRRALSTTARSLTDASGRRAGSILISQDVTDEVMALRARDDLVASVSHELRTPLTSILGYLDLALDEDDLSPRTRRGLEIAERNAGRLLEIIADLLAAAADDRLGMRVTVQPVNARLDEIAASAVEAIAAPAAERSIEVDGSGIEETTALIDPLRIRQVLDNIVGNAVKYNHDGGRVEVGVTADRDHAWIVVRDDGPGISAEELPHVFDRFFRADAVRRTSTHGSGLGLAISREIVRAHHGEITVRSDPGQGTTFIVRLPMDRTEGDG